MDKFSYSIGLGIGQNLRGMGTNDLNVEDFAQAVKDVLNRSDSGYLAHGGPPDCQ